MTQEIEHIGTVAMSATAPCPCGDNDGAWCSLAGCPYPQHARDTPSPQSHVTGSISVFEVAHPDLYWHIAKGSLWLDISDCFCDLTFGKFTRSASVRIAA